MTHQIDREQLRRLWEHALAEDGADRDITSIIAAGPEPTDAETTGPKTTGPETTATARLVARQGGVFAGQIVLDLLPESCAGSLTVTSQVNDGDTFKSDTVIATLAGSLPLLLGIERTLLNFLQRLCGVATLTRQYVDAIAVTSAKIYDTRKTVPGWRQLDKYAVRCGHGHNHRMSLGDAILVKDNHLAGVPVERLAATATAMLTQAGKLDPPPTFVEFEIDTVDQLDELLKVVGIDVVLLDNFTPEQMREAVALRNAYGLKNKVQLEASGGIDLEDVLAIAETGVERIAVGAITHSAKALDIGMEIEPN